MTQTSESRAGSRPAPDGGRGGKRRRPAGRVALYYRQVVAELRKVIWPTRNELITYTIVVCYLRDRHDGVRGLLDSLFTKARLCDVRLTLHRSRLSRPQGSPRTRDRVCARQLRRRPAVPETPGLDVADTGSDPSRAARDRARSCRRGACRCRARRRRGGTETEAVAVDERRRPSPRPTRRLPRSPTSRRPRSPTRHRPRSRSAGRGRRGRGVPGPLSRCPVTGTSCTPTPATRTG